MFRFCWLVSVSILGIDFFKWCYKHPESDVMKNLLFFILFSFLKISVILQNVFQKHYKIAQTVPIYPAPSFPYS